MPPISPDRLAATLISLASAPGPRLTWYSSHERVELSGRVLGMWLAKTAGMVSAEGSSPISVFIDLPVHWRAVTWACGTWLAGGEVIAAGHDSPGPIETGRVPPPVLPDGAIQVTHESSRLRDDADRHILIPLDAFALAWPDPLPPLALDGAADLMTYPDVFTAVDRQGHAPALHTNHKSISRDELFSRPDSPSPHHNDDHADGTVSPTAYLIHSSSLIQAVRECIQAWNAGRSVVMIPPEAGRDVLIAATRQEGITPPSQR